MSTAGTATDTPHLRRALELAERGRGRVSPNPLVGAVIVRDGEAIGEGHHAELGGPHAERAAIADCRARGEDPRGATLYVTLEPCAHEGRQPPCTEAILEAGIARVVVGSEDPTEKASGRGPGILRDGGVEVVQAGGAEAATARLLNQPFRKRARTGRPLVAYKAAISLDGRVAAAGGGSRWISSAESRELVHRWRAEVDAVAVGIGTALADDPLLTARPGEPSGGEASPPGRQPARIVFDSDARLPLDSQLVRTAADAPLIVIASAGATTECASALREAGAEVVELAGGGSAERLRAGLDELGRREIGEVLFEGGPRLAAALLEAGEVDEMRLFMAPLLLGAGPALLEGAGAAAIDDAVRPLALEHERVGPDILLRARLREW